MCVDEAPLPGVTALAHRDARVLAVDAIHPLRALIAKRDIRHGVVVLPASHHAEGENDADGDPRDEIGGDPRGQATGQYGAYLS